MDKTKLFALFVSFLITISNIAVAASIPAAVAITKPSVVAVTNPVVAIPSSAAVATPGPVIQAATSPSVPAITTPTVAAASTPAVRPAADTKVPDITQFDIPTSVQAYQQFTITVTAQDETAMKSIQIASNGSLGTVIYNCGSNPCTYSVQTAENTPNTYKYTVVASDTSNNKRYATKYVTVLPDTTPPNTTLTVNPTSISRGQSTSITCAANDAAGIATGWPRIVIKRPDNSVMYNLSATSYIFTPNFTDQLGTYNIFCGAKDINNNYGESSAPLTVTSIALTVAVSPSGSKFNLGDTVTIDADVKYPNNVEMTAGAVTATKPTPTPGGTLPLSYSNGKWTGNYTIGTTDSIGSWNISVSAADSAGNTGSGSASADIYNSYTVSIYSPTFRGGGGGGKGNGINSAPTPGIPVAPSYKRGETVKIIVDVFDVNNNKIGNANVTANDPNGGMIILYDDGNHDDGAASDGRYGNSYIIKMTDPTSWTLTINAAKSGNSGSASVGVTIAPATLIVSISAPPAGNVYNRGENVVVTANISYPNNGGPLTNGTVTATKPNIGTFNLAHISGPTWTGSYSIAASDQSGPWTITVSGQDGYGNAGSADRQVSISSVYTVMITSPAAGGQYHPGDIVPISATVKDVHNAGVVNAIVNVTKPAGGTIPLVDNGGGSYGTSYTIQPSDPIGNWTLIVSASKSGNSGSDSRTVQILVATQPPTWSSCYPIPASPTTYVKGATYQFNCTWDDDRGIDYIYFEFNGYNQTINGNGQKHVEAVVNRVDLAANPPGYNYRWYARDIDSNTAATPAWNYSINKAVSTASLSITPGLTVTYPAAVTPVCTETNPEAAGKLWRNAVDVTATENGTATVLPAGGLYSQHYECNVTETQNYTAASADNYVHVLQGDISNYIHMTILPSTTVDYGTTTNVTGWSTVPQGAADVNLTLYRDTNVIGTGAIVSDNATLNAGTYNYIYNTSGGQNWTATGVQGQLTVSQIANPVHLYLDGMLDQDVTITYGTQSNATGTDTSGNITIGNVMLWRDGAAVTNPEIAVLPAGTYAYKVNSSAGLNYVANSTGVTYYLTVDKVTPAVNLSVLTPITYGTPAGVTCTQSIGDSGATLELWRDGGLVSSSVGTVSDSTVLAAGTYGYVCKYVGSQNYTNYDSLPVSLVVDKATVTLTLLLDSNDNDTTAEQGVWVNATAILGMPGDITTIIDGTPAGTTSSPSETDINTAALSLGSHNITAVYAGNENYTTISAQHWLTVQDTIAPVVVISSPQNTTYNQADIDLNWTASEPASWAGYSLDSAANITLTGNTVITVGAGSHSVSVYAKDAAGNAGSASVAFSVNCLSRIYNSTIDGTYYAAHVGNLFLPNSTVYCSDVNDSTVINSTMTDSTILRSFVKGKVLVGMWIEDSWVDPTYGTSSGYSRISQDSNVTDSSIWYSNVTDHSYVYDSGVNYSSVTRSSLLTALVLNSSVTDSLVNNSNVTTSTITNSQLCAGMVANGAVIANNHMSSGYIIYNGVNYSTPTNIAAVCSPPDTTPPVINRIWNNTVVQPGQPANFGINATDNVGVANVTVEGNLSTYAYGDVWEYNLSVPSADGTYTYPVVATDYAGNNASQNIGIIINGTNITVDLNPPNISTIWPTNATAGITVTLFANVADESAVANCTLYVSGSPTANMSDGLPAPAATVSANWTPPAAGTYSMWASCSDIFGHVGSGVPVNMLVKAAPSQGGEGGGGAGFEAGAGKTTPKITTKGMLVSVFSPIVVDTGTTGTFTVTVANLGNGGLSGVIVIVSGITYPTTITPVSADIPAASSHTFSVSVAVPADATDSISRITVSATSVEGSSDFTSADFIIKKPGEAVPAIPTQPIAPAAPSGITGALLAIANNPLAAIGIALLLAGMAGWAYYRRPGILGRSRRDEKQAKNKL